MCTDMSWISPINITIAKVLEESDEAARKEIFFKIFIRDPIATMAMPTKQMQTIYQRPQYSTVIPSEQHVVKPFSESGPESCLDGIQLQTQNQLLSICPRISHWQFRQLRHGKIDPFSSTTSQFTAQTHPRLVWHDSPTDPAPKLQNPEFNKFQSNNSGLLHVWTQQS